MGNIRAYINQFISGRYAVTTMTGKQAVMEMLMAEGVRYIFGNPGTSESPIMSSLEEYPDLKYMLSTQEGVAMGMADEMVGFSFFGDGHAGQAEAMCRINTSGGKQKTKRRVSA